jgi:hypothetical protein
VPRASSASCRRPIKTRYICHTVGWPVTFLTSHRPDPCPRLTDPFCVARTLKANCKLELKFAQQSGVPIIPVMMEPNFAAKKWLGILTAGSIWTPMYKQSAVDAGIENLIVQMQLVVPDMSREGGGSGASESGSEAGDVEAWADSLFSYREMREELERLKLVELGSSVAQGGCSSLVVDGLDEEQALFSLPALVPKLAAGLLVSSTMDAVLSAG